MSTGPTLDASPLAVSVRGVRRAFERGVVALDGLDLDVKAGAFVALLGPSGCGKSTLLRLVAGLDRADAGEVRVDGPAPEIGFVFQDAHLLPWRTVEENVALPLELRGVPRAARLEAARRAIESVELSDASSRYPAELSGGMRMRASIARALVTRPRLLLLDEPFAALDEISRQRLDERLRSLWQETGITVLFVTHSIAEAVFLADRVVVMSRRPGRIVLDHAVGLPAGRAGALRGAGEFARETSILYDALLLGDGVGSEAG